MLSENTKKNVAETFDKISEDYKNDLVVRPRTFSVDDPVSSPRHYSGPIECIDAIESSMTREQFIGYLRGNVAKYVWRFDRKGKPVQDLEKAKWYIDKLIETLNKDGIK